MVLIVSAPPRFELPGAVAPTVSSCADPAEVPASRQNSWSGVRARALVAPGRPWVVVHLLPSLVVVTTAEDEKLWVTMRQETPSQLICQPKASRLLLLDDTQLRPLSVVWKAAPGHWVNPTPPHWWPPTAQPLVGDWNSISTGSLWMAIPVDSDPAL